LALSDDTLEYTRTREFKLESALIAIHHMVQAWIEDESERLCVDLDAVNDTAIKALS